MPVKDKNIVTTLSRRGFFKLAVRQAVAVSSLLYLFPGHPLLAESSENDNDSIQNALGLMSHDIFPLEGLDDRIYQKVAQAIIVEMSSSAEKNKMIREGMARLEDLSPSTPWEKLDPQPRIDVLTKYQSDPFFVYVRNLSLQIIYRDPAVWKLIGYGGSSIEYGGYVNRGFNDISWLPGTK